MEAHTSVALIAPLVIVVTIAALTDVKKGVIPNWLTLPVLCCTPLLFGLFQGLSALGASFIGLGVCGLVPLILFTRRAIGGGDVKLFAAIGAITGIQTGLEIQLFSFLIAATFALGLLTWEGKLIRTFVNAGWLVLNGVLPRVRQRAIPFEAMSSVRLGGAVFVAVLWMITRDYLASWG